jgi:hypothetical protein
LLILLENNGQFAQVIGIAQSMVHIIVLEIRAVGIMQRGSVEMRGKKGTALLREYIQTHPNDIQEALSRLLPESVIGIFDIDNWGWVNNLTNINGDTDPTQEDPVMDRAEAEINGDLEDIEKAIQETLNSDSRFKFAQVDRLRQMEETISNRDLLGYLGSHNILPKYG